MRYVEESASAILEHLNITKTPVDPIKCADYLGVHVQSIPFDEGIAGLFVMKDNMAYIMYNSNENEQRQRFTIAHELGHFTLHKDGSFFIDKSEKVLYKNSDGLSGDLLKEREANAFAASLLMPKHFIEFEINNAPKEEDVIEYLAKKFNVTTLAISFRLSNLGYEVGW